MGIRRRSACRPLAAVQAHFQRTRPALHRADISTVRGTAIANKRIACLSAARRAANLSLSALSTTQTSPPRPTVLDLSLPTTVAMPNCDSRAAAMSDFICNSKSCSSNQTLLTPSSFCRFAESAFAGARSKTRPVRWSIADPRLFPTEGERQCSRRSRV